jgi:hypothetical protein
MSMDTATAHLIFIDKIEQHVDELRRRENNVEAMLEDIKKLLSRRKRFEMVVSRNRQTRMIDHVDLIELEPEEEIEETALTPAKRKPKK